MPLTIYTGNRMEHLVAHLATMVSESPLPPLAPETIIVQSPGMERWVAMALADRLGGWANADYPFPNAMIWRIFRAVLGELPPTAEDSPFAPEPLRWRLMTILPSLLERREYAPLKAYLADDGAGRKLFQLAGTIADTFDQYGLYRPELLLRWERGEGDDWQPDLWRRLTAEAAVPHRATLLAEFRRAVSRLREAPAGLPARLSLIGISALPPFHLEVLTRLAGQLPVNLFLLNPCRTYWGGIVSAREQARLERRDAESAPPDDYFELGNPLLASLGRTGRDFFELLLDSAEPGATVEDFTAGEETTLLAMVQGDILDLRDRTAAGEVKGTIAPGDASIRVHSCHSPLREVEVLYDTLLELFAGDPTLTPRDVLVMTPEIESYAPYVSAVFGSPESPERRIPYAIADRSLRREGVVAEALIKVLRLAGSRCTASEVLDFLALAPVARRYAIGQRGVATIRGWVREAGIRWGIDRADRGEQKLPAFAENSWRSGLDRLLLGYAMAGEREGRFCAGILPFDRVAGEAALLGSFLEFTGRLFATLRQLRQPRPAPEWLTLLRGVLVDFIAADRDEERELLAIDGTIDALAAAWRVADFSDELTLEQMTAWLDERLGRLGPGGGFLTGGVTFCAMLPMRSIPFRVIALLGMDDDAYPRRNPPSGFNLIAAAPRPGDRSLRDEDRYLFLEALLSARQRLHISYLGQGIVDGGTRPPSVLVSELLDYLERGFVVAGAADKNLRETVEVRQRLQPFSRDYFRGDAGSPLFSYSRENLAGSLAKGRGAEPRPFMVAPLPVPDEVTTITLADLAAFLANPARQFLRLRLGVHLERSEELLPECEPFLPDPLERYQLDQEVVATLLAGGDPELQREVLRSRGLLPPGAIGAEVFRRRVAAVADFAAEVGATLAGEALSPLEVDLPLGGVRLVGRLRRLGPAGLVQYRFAKLKAKDRLRAWLEHLALNAVAPAECPRRTVLFASDATVTYEPLTAAAGELERLVGLYRQGLAAPLRFFPESSLEYARKSREPKKADQAPAAARKKWRGSEEYPGEGEEPAFRRCFGAAEPFAGDFAAVALTVYGPLLDCQTERKRK